LFQLRDPSDPPEHRGFYRDQREKPVGMSAQGTPQSGYSISPPERPVNTALRSRDSPGLDLYERSGLEPEGNGTSWTRSGSRPRKFRRVESHDDGIGTYPARLLSSSSSDQSDSNAEADEDDDDEDGAENSADDSSLMLSARRRPDPRSTQSHPVQTAQPLTPTSDQKRRRKHLGLPILRPDCVGILSHTVFIGHLHKQLAESRLQALCAEVAEGPVVDCNFIPPRGCAFVTFATRRAAHRAVTQMDQSTMNGRQIKVAWAPNRGIKEHEAYCKAYWDVEEGCTYLPLSEVTKLTRPQLDELLEGYGEVDEDSVADARLRDLILTPTVIPAARNSGGFISGGKHRSGQRHHNSRNRHGTSISSSAFSTLPQLPTLPAIVQCTTPTVLRPSVPTATVPLIVPVATPPLLINTSVTDGASSDFQGANSVSASGATAPISGSPSMQPPPATGAVTLPPQSVPSRPSVFPGGFLHPRPVHSMDSGYASSGPQGKSFTTLVHIVADRNCNVVCMWPTPSMSMGPQPGPFPSRTHAPYPTSGPVRSNSHITQPTSCSFGPRMTERSAVASMGPMHPRAPYQANFGMPQQIRPNMNQMGHQPVELRPAYPPRIPCGPGPAIRTASWAGSSGPPGASGFRPGPMAFNAPPFGRPSFQQPMHPMGPGYPPARFPPRPRGR
uniref:RRM domain-containing protein n=1 Tax=Echinostoma caproni TaxID=27848 RepID=A0A183AJF4_9TREM